MLVYLCIFLSYEILINSWFQLLNNIKFKRNIFYLSHLNLIIRKCVLSVSCGNWIFLFYILKIILYLADADLDFRLDTNNSSKHEFSITSTDQPEIKKNIKINSKYFSNIREKTVFEGDNVKLRCKIYGLPKTSSFTIKWHYNDSIISSIKANSSRFIFNDKR